MGKQTKERKKKQRKVIEIVATHLKVDPVTVTTETVIPGNWDLQDAIGTQVVFETGKVLQLYGAEMTVGEMFRSLGIEDV